MERQQFYPCPSDSCAGAKKAYKGLTKHKMLDIEVTRVKCLECGLEHEMDFKLWIRDYTFSRKPKRTYLTKYPRIEPHTGELVTSKEHETETVRAMGYHAAPNGVNEAYDDSESDHKGDISLDDDLTTSFEN